MRENHLIVPSLFLEKPEQYEGIKQEQQQKHEYRRKSIVPNG
jgi:hypothetical protein